MMFAVPGWAVSADTLVQSKPTDRTSDSTSKKRKRDDRGTPVQGSQLSSDALQKLWTGQEEGGKRSKKDKAKAKKKKAKAEGAERAGTAEGQDDAGSSSRVSYPKQAEKSEKTKTLEDRNAGTDNDVSLPSKQGEAPKSGSKVRSKRPSKELGPGAAQVHDKAQQAIKSLQNLPPQTATKLTPLQQKMRDKLTSARFRHLNETLYTSSSATSLALFQASPDLFAEYHAGFAQQVKDSWPENPLDTFIQSVRNRAQIGHDGKPKSGLAGLEPLPRRKTGSCTIADLGCGDAPLARALQPRVRKLGLQLHSYDLHKANDFITVSDIANLPLREGEADVAIFCLSLMGTNWVSFIEEAWRVLRGDGKGELWVAEVKSRFGGATALQGKRGSNKKSGANIKTDRRPPTDIDNDDFLQDEDTGDADHTDISTFVEVIERRGFSLQTESVKKANKMFVSMVFFKNRVPTAGKYDGWRWNGSRYDASVISTHGRKIFIDKEPEQVKTSPEEEAKALKPCVYKKR